MTETGERSPNEFQNIHFTSATWASDTKERQKRCLIKTYFWPPDPREDIIPLTRNGLRNGNIPHVQSETKVSAKPARAHGAQRGCRESKMFPLAAFDCWKFNVQRPSYIHPQCASTWQLQGRLSHPLSQPKPFYPHALAHDNVTRHTYHIPTQKEKIWFIEVTAIWPDNHWFDSYK